MNRRERGEHRVKKMESWKNGMRGKTNPQYSIIPPFQFRSAISAVKKVLKIQ
jgi:hypothetical protein